MKEEGKQKNDLKNREDIQIDGDIEEKDREMKQRKKEDTWREKIKKVSEKRKEKQKETQSRVKREEKVRGSIEERRNMDTVDREDRRRERHLRENGK